MSAPPTSLWLYPAGRSAPPARFLGLPLFFNCLVKFNACLCNPKSCPVVTFPGFLPLFLFTPKPLTLSLAKLEAASIAIGASALAANLASAPIPLPFLVFLGFFVFSATCKSGGYTTIPKPVIPITFF